MRFISLHMTGFRGTLDLEVKFEPEVTVIVGRNGAGKTSILDALGMLITFVHNYHHKTLTLDSDVGHTIHDIRSGADTSNLELVIEVYNPQTGSVVRDALEFSFHRNGSSSSFETHERKLRWPNTLEPKPRFIFYRQERGFEQGISRWTDDQNVDVLDQNSVQARSLERNMHAIGDLEKWWDLRDAQEARLVRDTDQDYRDPQLEAIRNLIAKIDSFSDIAFSSTASPSGLHFVKNDGTTVHVGNLSVGERSYLILLADLARRLQVFAPDSPLEKIPAIVLIDEIELNLHPAWQSEIVPTLMDVFQACQFIVTTHSPQVLSGVESRRVRILEQDSSGRTKVSTPLSTRGRTSNYLLEGVFAASERYPPIDTLIGDFNAAIDQEDVPAATEALEKIEQEIGDDAPTLLVLRKRLKKLRGRA